MRPETCCTFHLRHSFVRGGQLTDGVVVGGILTGGLLCAIQTAVPIYDEDQDLWRKVCHRLFRTIALETAPHLRSRRAPADHRCSLLIVTATPQSASHRQAQPGDEIPILALAFHPRSQRTIASHPRPIAR